VDGGLVLFLAPIIQYIMECCFGQKFNGSRSLLADNMSDERLKMFLKNIFRTKDFC